ncbi:HAD family phosphatase [Streptomyces sp. NBC_01007]|nr:HAD family phosphatase [Streptomyces sp. NBC_01007]WRZ95674.1 HAD family phosphatase [Streptomyces sp. NBC_01007]
MEALRTLRAAAVNIDGVLLDDSFSPVLYRLVRRYGGAYTCELEQRLFSQPRLAAARVLLEATGSTLGEQEIIGEYFAERERYLDEHPVRPLDGAAELLHRLRALGLEVVCYGGLDGSHFQRHLGRWAGLFTEPRYLCTDGFRPGIREIVRDRFGLGYGQVLFIDDVARFAQRARELDVPFIGRPSGFEHGFQRELMRGLGVRHLVRGLGEIDEALLRTLDGEAAAGTVWRDAPPTGPAEDAVGEGTAGEGAVGEGARGGGAVVAAGAGGVRA